MFWGSLTRRVAFFVFSILITTTKQKLHCISSRSLPIISLRFVHSSILSLATVSRTVLSKWLKSLQYSLLHVTTTKKRYTVTAGCRSRVTPRQTGRKSINFRLIDLIRLTNQGITFGGRCSTIVYNIKILCSKIICRTQLISFLFSVQS